MSVAAHISNISACYIPKMMMTMMMMMMVMMTIKFINN